MSKVANKLRRENIEAVEREIDSALFECNDAPSFLVVEIVLSILDTAEMYERLNPAERRVVCDYVTEEYGYDF